MAIDTRDKRASVLRHSQPGVPLFPDPDGAISSQADRQLVGTVYPGINAGGAASFHVSWARNANVMIQGAMR